MLSSCEYLPARFMVAYAASSNSVLSGIHLFRHHPCYPESKTRCLLLVVPSTCKLSHSSGLFATHASACPTYKAHARVLGERRSRDKSSNIALITKYSSTIASVVCVAQNSQTLLQSIAHDIRCCPCFITHCWSYIDIFGEFRAIWHQTRPLQCPAPDVQMCRYGEKTQSHRTSLCLLRCCSINAGLVCIYMLSFDHRCFSRTQRTMPRKQKYSFPLRRNHANGPDRRYTAMLMVTQSQHPDKRRKTQSIAQRNETATALHAVAGGTSPKAAASPRTDKK